MSAVNRLVNILILQFAEIAREWSLACTVGTDLSHRHRRPQLGRLLIDDQHEIPKYVLARIVRHIGEVEFYR